MKTKTVDDFIDDIANHYPPFTEVDYRLEDLKKIKFNRNECLFVWDVRLGEMIFKKGIENLLGFSDEDITLHKFVALFHPDDDEIIRRIGQAAIHHSLHNPESNKDHCLYVAHRIKNNEGDFIKVLVQSTPYQLDDQGLVTAFLVKLSDISFVDTSDTVQFKFTATGLDQEVFHDLVFENNKSIFTPRELDIIMQIEKGHTNPKIGELLKISKHTVATHRKKIMKKSGCHSAKELLLYCREKGVI